MFPGRSCYSVRIQALKAACYSIFRSPSYSSLKGFCPLHRPKDSALSSPNSKRKHFVSSSTVCSKVLKNRRSCATKVPLQTRASQLTQARSSASCNISGRSPSAPSCPCPCYTISILIYKGFFARNALRRSRFALYGRQISPAAFFCRNTLFSPVLGLTKRLYGM